MHLDFPFTGSIKIVKDLANTDIVEDASKEMQESGVLQETTESKAAKTAVKAAKLDLVKKFQGEEWTAAQGLELANAVATGVSKGLGNLVKAYKTRSPYYFFSG